MDQFNKWVAEMGYGFASNAGMVLYGEHSGNMIEPTENMVIGYYLEFLTTEYDKYISIKGRDSRFKTISEYREELENMIRKLGEDDE